MSNGLSADARHDARQRLVRPIAMNLHDWLRTERAGMSKHNPGAKAINYMFEGDSRWEAFTRFLDDGRICLTNNAAERALRGIAKHVSLYTPSLSVCKHWKCVGVSNATRASFSGYGSFDRLRRQVIGTDLIRRTGYKLHSRKDVGFDKVPDHVVCDA